MPCGCSILPTVMAFIILLIIITREIIVVCVRQITPCRVLSPSPKPAAQGAPLSSFRRPHHQHSWRLPAPVGVLASSTGSASQLLKAPSPAAQRVPPSYCRCPHQHHRGRLSAPVGALTSSTEGVAQVM